MTASLKGQLGTKSSALSPTSSKYTTQLLVLDHMTNHYRKISTAKPAIDNAPPKSMFSSQKMRDRKNRRLIEKYGSRPTSRMSYRPESRDDDIYDETQWDEPEDEEERQVQEIMRTTLRVPMKALPQDSTLVTTGLQSEVGGLGTRMRPYSTTFQGMAQAVQSTNYQQRQRPMSSRSATSLASNVSHASRASNPLKVTYDGDVLHKHAHVFTEPQKPFTPQGRTAMRQIGTRTVHLKPNPGSTAESKMAENLTITDTLTESMLMEMSLQSHAPLRSDGDRGTVPPLNISLDKDHQSWLQEQASKAQIRVRNGIVKSDAFSEDIQEQPDSSIALGNTDVLRFTRTGMPTKYFGIKSPTGRRLSQAEEEQKYVAFAQEVTQDIVNRGVCSDRVLHRIFENHIERKKGELEERRLRAIITDIRMDLGVQFVSAEKSLKEDQDLCFAEAIKNGDKKKMNGNTTETGSLEMTQNTLTFGETTDVFSTIGSKVRNDSGDDLSVTQVLKQYQMDLTVQDAESEEHALKDHGDYFGSKEVAEDGQHDAELGMNGDSTQYPKINEDDRGEQHAKSSPLVKPRKLLRQNASAAKQPEVESDADAASELSCIPAHKYNDSRQTSAHGTDTEETREEEADEEYEEDYDADEDDGREGDLERNSDDDF
ncbi:hypothetical protein C0Q70_13212 [Pomacea canaliculata]|uniref:Uncharacterized protein n=1 Tax=Pomacea canaliculata TaxID=400727 RepID=A0A2T7NWM2_POMCA|nr:hypothetical protein C0Q70_13212 [Pomacea canaliculata]